MSVSSLVTFPLRTEVLISIVRVVASPAFVVPSTFQGSPTISPCGGCFSPAAAAAFPPNGMQKKSPRSMTNTGAGIGSGCSSCQGLT